MLSNRAKKDETGVSDYEFGPQKNRDLSLIIDSIRQTENEIRDHAAEGRHKVKMLGKNEEHGFNHGQRSGNSIKGAIY